MSSKGKNTRDTLLAKDPDFYKKIGRLGGKAKVPKGFAMADKEVLKERARLLGLNNRGRKRDNI